MAYRHGESKHLCKTLRNWIPQHQRHLACNALVKPTAGLIMLFVISHSFIMYPGVC